MEKYKKIAIIIVGTAWALTQLYEGVTGRLDYLQLLPLHLYFALVMVFLLRPISKKKSWFLIFDLVLIGLTVAGAYYYMDNFMRIISRIPAVSPVTQWDMFFGTVTIGLVLEAGRRTVGLFLPILGGVCIIYSFYGPHFPGLFAHGGLSATRFIDFMYLSQEGLFGVPLRVSAVFVFLFVLFGAFLKTSGIGDFYNNLAMSVAGGMRGASAKVAVISSGLMGTISGSAVANATTTGTITIPMMVKGKYKPVVAAAIEALASTGSQIMPPLMGAAAFIMASITGIPYFGVVIAAIIPGILYYTVVYTSIHILAVKGGMGAIVKEDRPKFLPLILRDGFMLIPIFALIYYLAAGYSVARAIIFAIGYCLLVVLITFIRNRDFSQLIAAFYALSNASKSAIHVAVPCAIAGIVVGVLNLTGLSLKLTQIIIGVSDGNIALLLALVAVLCLILGMGMPTTAAYISVAIIAIPALIRLGVPTLHAHMFGFYFANFSFITPPIALAAYATAGIADENSFEVGKKAFVLGLPLYILPFMFILFPSLLLTEGVLLGIISGIRATLIIISFLAIILNFLFTKLRVTEKILFGLGGLLLFFPNIILDITGVFLFVLAILFNMEIIGSKEKHEQPAATVDIEMDDLGPSQLNSFSKKT